MHIKDPISLRTPKKGPLPWTKQRRGKKIEHIEIGEIVFGTVQKSNEFNEKNFGTACSHIERGG